MTGARTTGRRVGDSPLAAVLFDPGPVTHLAASVAELAGRVRSQVGADLAAIYVTDETDPDTTVLGVDVADPADAVLLAPVIGPDDDLLGLPGQAVWSGMPLIWHRLLGEAVVLDRLAQLVGSGTDMDAVRARLQHAGGIAVPLATPNAPRLGALCLLSFAPERRLGVAAMEQVEEVVRQLSLTVRNHQWRDRNRQTRQVLSAVLESIPSAVLVTDLRQRLLYSNAAASALLEVDLTEHLGTPLGPLAADLLRWRFTDPQAYESAQQHARAAPDESRRDQLRTVEGRVLDRYTAPVHDTSGEPLGRIEILTDITATERALGDARRLAEETARLRLVEELRAREETALARAAHLMASALTQADVHWHLADQAPELVGAELGVVLLLERTGELSVGPPAVWTTRPSPASSRVPTPCTCSGCWPPATRSCAATRGWRPPRCGTWCPRRPARS